MIEAKQIRTGVVLSLMVSSLSACATIDSRPQPLWEERQALQAFQNCDLATASQAIKALQEDSSKIGPYCSNAPSTKEARNRFITSAMDLIDARYKDFTTDLSREAKGNNLGFNFLILAATAGASVAGEKTANALASGATALSGTRDSFNKDVLFEQTIAALVDEMYTMRTDARAAILVGLNKPYSDYPIEMAARDIEAYDEAADLNRAIQRLVKTAAERADKAQADEKELKASLKGCVPKKNTFVARYKIKQYLDGISADAAGDGKMANIAKSMGIDTAGKDRAALTSAIFDKLASEACGLEELNTIAGTWDPTLKF